MQQEAPQAAPQVVKFTELEQAKLEASAHKVNTLLAQQQAANLTAALLEHEIPKAREAHNALVAQFTAASKARDNPEAGASAVGNAEIVGTLPANREARRRAARLKAVNGAKAPDAAPAGPTPEQRAEAAANGAAQPPAA